MSTDKNDICGRLLTNPFGEQFFREINRNSFMQCDSATLYQQIFAQKLTAPDTLHIVLGSDSGLLAQFIKTRGPGKNSFYLIVELVPVKNKLQHEGLIPSQTQSLSIITPDALQQKLETDRMTDYFLAEKIQLHASLSVRDSNLPQYSILSSTVAAAINARALQLRTDINQRSFYEEQLKNICENRYPAKNLIGLFEGKTAVILGGGPSLDRFIPWVKEHRDSIILIAASRVSRRLIQSNLIPDIICSVDQQEVSFVISREMLLFPDYVLFIHGNHTVSELCAFWHGPSMYFGPRFPWKTKLNKNNIDPWGPTVTNTALGAAVAMGCSRAIMIGVDLCYDEFGMTHASGSNESTSGPKLDDSIQVFTNSGRTAETSPDYYAAIDHLSRQARAAGAKRCQVISLSPDAAKIDTVEFIPVEELTLEPLQCSPSEVIRNALPVDTATSRINDGQQACSELKRVHRLMTKMSSSVQEAEELMVTSPPTAALSARLDSINKQLENIYPDIASLAQNYNMRAFLQATLALKQSSANERLKHYKSYFEAWKNGLEDLCALIEAAIKRTEARIEEDSFQPDFDLIFAQWEQDRHWGRCLALPAKRLDLQDLLPPRWKETFKEWNDSAQSWIRAYLNESEQPIPPRDLNGPRIKALNLFNQRNAAALERLFSGLETHPDKEEAGRVQILVKAYYHEINGETDDALKCYELLIGDKFTPLVEEALRRISVICLSQKKLEMALVALECLSNASPSYKPRYADLLARTGQREQAAETYTRYLESHPDDLEVMIKLGRNYRDMNMEDGARQIFELVLQQHPDNKTAKTLLDEHN